MLARKAALGAVRNALNKDRILRESAAEPKQSPSDDDTS